MMEIKRIDSYNDSRFSPEVLRQHGAFTADGVSFGFEVISDDSAVVHCGKAVCPNEVIEEFRFYTEHISKFYSESGELIAEYEPVSLFWAELSKIQPSQFYLTPISLMP